MFGIHNIQNEYEIGPIAAANNLIVVAPQGDRKGPTDCWDVVDPGYTGDGHYT
jgi:hypothetical protein